MLPPTVYVPQLPARFDVAAQVWIPTINIDPAKAWGELRIMFPQTVSRMATAPLIDAMREIMKEVTPDDAVCAVGDPALIAAAACMMTKRTGVLRLLRWDRYTKDYLLVEVKI
jgi:hypothetical protein